ncbi:MAG: MFS transporter [Cytophagales bacterium]|nr:MFS transporter [Armatimonadota bacterium]
MPRLVTPPEDPAERDPASAAGGLLSPKRRAVPPALRVRRATRSVVSIPRAARQSLRWDFLAGACSGAYMGLAFPFFTRIARGDLHASETAIALLAAAPFLGNLCSPLWARQMEGRSKMPFVQGAWITARSLLLLTPLAFAAWPFIAIVGGLQFVGTIAAPAYTSLMRDIYPDRARGRLMGYVRVVAQILTFLATLTAGRLLDHGVSYRFLFPVAGLFGIAAALAFRQVRALAPSALPVGEKLSTRQFALDTLTILRDNEPYRWFAFSVFTYGFGNLLVTPLYGLYQVDVLHISNTQIANLANFASLWSIVGFVFWGWLMDRIGAPRTVLFSIVCIASIALVYFSTHAVNGLFFASALSGFGFAGIELSYLAAILAYAETGRAAQYQSLHSLLLGVRGILAPLVGIPLMKALGYQNAFLIGFALMAVGGGMQYLATGKARRAASATTF